MKIAISAHGEGQQVAVDSRFGRADYFMIYDQEKDTWEGVPNTQNLEAAHGAGIQAGQTIAKTGAKVLITGHVGPKAFKVLEAGKITMYSIGEMNGTVEATLKAFQQGKLAMIETPGAMHNGK